MSWRDEARLVLVARDAMVDRMDRVEAEGAVEVAVELDFRERAQVHEGSSYRPIVRTSQMPPKQASRPITLLPMM